MVSRRVVTLEVGDRSQVDPSMREGEETSRNGCKRRTDQRTIMKLDMEVEDDSIYRYVGDEVRPSV